MTDDKVILLNNVGGQNTKMGLGDFHSSYINWLGKRENWVLKLPKVISHCVNKQIFEILI
jgi:hypothetical protein